MDGDTTWVGKKPIRRLGGMVDALSLASDLGFTIPSSQEDDHNISSVKPNDKSDNLVKVLRELTTVQQNLANLQVELQGRKKKASKNFSEELQPIRSRTKRSLDLSSDDKNVAHLTHVSEMEKKCESLSRMTTILKDVIQNKDRIIARLQQPYSLDCIPVEAEFQKEFSELLLKAASDYGALTAAVSDIHWSQNFREPPTVWSEMLRPIPVALASCTRLFEAMSAMRDSFAGLQKLRIGESCQATPARASQSQVDTKYAIPAQWSAAGFSVEDPSSDDVVTRIRRQQDGSGEGSVEQHDTVDQSQADLMKQRRLSWPCSPNPGI